MKTCYLLTQLGTNVIFDTIFTSKELAQAQLEQSELADPYDTWEIVELKLQ